MAEGFDIPADWQVVDRQMKACFPGFTDSEIETLIPYLDHRSYQAETVVWNQGDPSEYIGFLVSGKLVVKREGEFPGRYILLAILEGSSMFGEISLASPHEHSVAVTATALSHALIMTHANADALFENHPALGVKFLKYVLSVTGLRLKQSGERLAELL